MDILDEILHNRVMAAVNSSMAVTEQVRQAKVDVERYHTHESMAPATLGYLHAAIIKINLHNDDIYAHLVEIENMTQEAK